jgi:AcrR family transcriptional regulator
MAGRAGGDFRGGEDPPPGAGGPRSVPARRAILAAARARFAAEGYASATVRAIAADAGIDASMVMRYFGSKEGLFAAAADIDLRLPSLKDVRRDRLGEVLARHFVSIWEGGSNDEALIFLLRTAPTNQAASERMREIFAQQVRPGIGSLLGGGTDGARRAGLVASQLIGLALCRYVLRLEPIVSQDPQQLIADIAETLQRYLTGPLSQAQAQARDLG